MGAGFATPVMAVAGIAVLVLSCGDGAVEPAPPPPAPVATTVSVSPASATLTALEETARFTAEVRDQNGQVMAGAAVAWATSDASVAPVDASGLVTAAANGSTTITATAGSVSGAAAVTVAQVVSSVGVSPSADTLVALGDTVRLVAEATDANGHGVAGVTEFVWSSSDTLVARVDDSGLVESVAEGEAAVTATASEVTGRAELTVVSPLPTTIAASRDTVAFTALRQTAQLAVEVRDQVERVMAEALVSWSSGDTLVAAVDSAGLVTAVGGGTTKVTAAAGDVADTVVVTVMQSAGTVVVSPSESTVALRDTLRLTAEAFDANGHAVEGATFSWSSSNVGVAPVDDSGLVEALAEGTVRIRATAGDASGVAEITVENPDRAALVALYEAADGPNWIDNTNWLTDAPLGEWYGIGTDASGRVVEIDLSGHWDRDAREYRHHGLAGTIPPELGLLTNLVGLNLYANGLTGTIPPELGHLASLETLYLRGNSLTGQIPPELGSLANLEWLELDQNNLVGPIPPELGSLASLETLDLRENSLTGQIPPELGSLANLEWLQLDQNNLVGPIPPELGSLANLEWLELDQNNLVGPIPPELGKLTNLTFLRLYENRLTGPIPAELTELTGLRYLSVGVNLLTGPIPEWLSNFTNLESLDLSWNNLTGPIPPELGNLRSLRSLSLHRNALTGPIPQTFLQLDRLTYASFGANESVCVPGTSAFLSWLRAIGNRDEESEILCNATDVTALRSLYESTDGTAWNESAGWSGDGGVADWHGVSADSLGRVTILDLSRNGLAGRLPASVASLASLTELRVAGNTGLAGRLPLGLAHLPLRALHYSGTGLCAPVDASFRDWLSAISSHEGTGADCAPLSDRAVLEALYHATDGPNWTYNRNWLTDAPVRQWFGVWADRDGRVETLFLGGVGLTGPIPAELGSLTRLKNLVLDGNQLTGAMPPELANLTGLEDLSLADNALTGPIPPEFANLTNLRNLTLFFNQLSGSIPPELGDLASLEGLHLAGNKLTGPIPPEFGNLANATTLSLPGNQLTGGIPAELGRLSHLESLGLGRNELTGSIPRQFGDLAALEFLYLSDNALSGAIPSELGNLGSLKSLYLDDNDFTGPIPPELGNLSAVETMLLSNNNLSGSVPSEFGGMSSLRRLSLTNNVGMSGSLPTALTALDELGELQAAGTGLCAPADPDFLAWLEGVHKRRINRCIEADPPTAYLVQAVQSREFPVPLVAGERALLRVFPTARQATDAGIPAVRARFYIDGREIHVEDITGKSTPIPTEVDEGRLSTSANAEIPAHVVQPGLEMVIDVDPNETLDPALGVARRIPETGRLAVEVRTMPVFDLTLIPFLWNQNPDSSIMELIREMAADPENHEMLGDTRTLLPVGDLEVTAHEPVLSSSNSAFYIRDETKAIRAMEGGTGHFMGMMTGPVTGAAGVAFLPGRVSFSMPFESTVAHELGHNLNLQHAPCRQTPGSDPSYPYAGGVVGAWGYDFEGGGLISPSTPDLMAYCDPQWISDYQFSNALRYRLFDEGSPTSAAARSLLLWGGVNAEGDPHLQPAFVVDAPALLPDSAGEHRITGRTADGGQLFSFSFAMPETADGDGSSSFAYVLPVRAGWEGDLASISLSGPGGSATLDGDSNEPMVILRNPRNGQVRGILRDLPAATRTAADAVGGATAPGLKTLFSRGMPGAEAWRW